MENNKIDRLEARIIQLEKEVEKLKVDKGQLQTPRVEPISKPSERIKTAEPLEPTRPSEPTIPEVQAKPKKGKVETDWETLIGKVWLPRIFIFVLLLGVVWGFRIAVDAGWLNETNRVIIGFVVAGLFYYVGDRQIKKDRIALGKVLLVGFIATLLVTTFAMHILYGMIPTGVAFPLNIIWVALGIYLAHIYQSQAMGVMVAVAGYLIPFLVAGFETTAFVNMMIAYELVYYIALLWFAVRNQYRILFYLSTIFLHVVYLAMALAAFGVLDKTHFLYMTIGILIQHEVIFYTLLKGKLEKLRAFPVLFASFIVTLIWANAGFTSYGFEIAFTIYVATTTLRYAFVAYQAKTKENSSLFSIAIVTATLGVATLILELVDNEYMMAALYLVQGTLAVYLGYTFRSKMQRYIGYFIYYGTALFLIMDTYIYRYEYLILWAIFIGTLYLHVIIGQKYKEELTIRLNIVLALLAHVLFLMRFDYYYLSFGPLYWLAIVLSLYGLYRLTKKDMTILLRQVFLAVNMIVHLVYISYLASEIITDSTNGQVLLTTAGWAIYALVFVYLGMNRQRKSFRMLGIGLILFTLLKLIFFDLAFISLTTRSILFVFIGLIGIVVSRFIYGKNK